MSTFHRRNTALTESAIEPKNDDGHASDREESKLADMKLPLLILIVMTVVMFIINIAQLATMNHVVGTLWLTLFPALIFAAFLLAFSIVCWKQQRKPDNTLPLLAFQKHRWAETLNRLSIACTLIFSIVLCNFVYMNNYAVPEYRAKRWQAHFGIMKELAFPAVVVFRSTERPATAHLTQTGNFTAFCENVTDDYPNRHCFGDLNSFTSEGLGQVEYVAYDGSQDGISLKLREALGLIFQFDYDSSRADGAIDPLLGLAIFDSRFLSSFPQAFNCGLLSVQHFPALISHEVNIELVYINDAVHAVPPHPGKACADLQASNMQYATYRTTLTPLQEAGNSELLGNRSCDQASDNYTRPCRGNLFVQFSSLVNETHTSSRRFNFKRALTEEGGIVGYVQFFAFFLTLWR